MASAFQEMIASTAAEITKRYSVDDLVTKTVKNRLIMSWLLCVKFTLSFKDFQVSGESLRLERVRRDLRNACQVSGESWRLERVRTQLPLQAKSLIDSFLGSLQDMGRLFLPASAYRAQSLQMRAINKLKLQAALAKSLWSDVHPQIQKFTTAGATKGEITVAQQVLCDLDKWDHAVRDNEPPSKFVLQAFEDAGFLVVAADWVLPNGKVYPMGASPQTVGSASMRVELNWS